MSKNYAYLCGEYEIIKNGHIVLIRRGNIPLITLTGQEQVDKFTSILDEISVDLDKENNPQNYIP